MNTGPRNAKPGNNVDKDEGIQPIHSTVLSATVRILHCSTGHSESLISEERHHGRDKQIGKRISKVSNG